MYTLIYQSTVKYHHIVAIDKGSKTSNKISFQINHFLTKIKLIQIIYQNEEPKFRSQFIKKIDFLFGNFSFFFCIQIICKENFNTIYTK